MSRRRAREFALQALYGIDQRRRSGDSDGVLGGLWKAQLLALIQDWIAPQAKQQCIAQPGSRRRVNAFEPATDTARRIMIGKCPGWPALAASTLPVSLRSRHHVHTQTGRIQKVKTIG